MDNIDRRTVRGFGEEWSAFDQSNLSPEESRALFENYFGLFPWSELGENAEGADIGCGSGRWAAHVAPRVGKIHCVDASAQALAVAQRNLAGIPNCTFHRASVGSLPFAPGSLDFAYSLGVLHHVPDPQAALRACARALKPGAPLLVYMYYAFDNRPLWFRTLWKVSDLVRKLVSRLPSTAKRALTTAIAAIVYLPLARAAKLAERLGASVSSFPLAFYRNLSFYTMRTDALDRFGTALEQRFTAAQIEHMMLAAGLEQVHFSNRPPHWCAVAIRGRGGSD